MKKVDVLDVEPTDIPNQQDKATAAQELSALRGDTLLMLLVIGSLLSWLISLAIGLALLVALLGGLDLQNLRVKYSPLAVILDNLNLLQLGLILLAGFLLPALVFYLLARRRVVQNQSLWPLAGCPSCGDEILLRMKRRGRDRRYGWIGLPVGRYTCHTCGWNDLRIRRGPNLLPPVEDWSQVVAPKWDRSLPLADPGTLNQTDLSSGENSGGRDKWAKRLGDPVNPTMFEGDEAAEEAALAGVALSFPPDTGIQPDDRKAIADQELNTNSEMGDEAISIEITVPSGPSLRADTQLEGILLGELEPGKQVLLLVEVIDKAESAWQQLQTSDRQGWLVRGFIQNNS